MKRKTAGSIVQITDPKAARLLLDFRETAYLYPFARSENTVTGVARRTGWEPALLLHRVRRFERLGLLRVARLEPRAGRPIKHYRMSAEEFFIPHTVAPAATVEDMLEAMDATLRRQMYRNIVRATAQITDSARLGWRVFADENGFFHTDFAPGPGVGFSVLGPEAPAVIHRWTTLRLDFPAAKALQRELDELFYRYLNETGSQVYQFRIALAPQSDEPT